MLVISLQGTFKEVEKKIQEAGKIGEILEFRLDLMEGIDLTRLSKLRKKCKLPVIFTFRGRGRQEKLLEFLSLKPEYVDLEYDVSFASKIDPSIQIISSFHDFEKTPKDLEGILKQMNNFPAAIKKIATMAHSSIDALRMLNFVKKHRIAGMCMGKKGEVTRILGPLVGAPLTYAFLDKATAPGQIRAEELINLYRFHHLNEGTKAYALIGDPVDQSIGHFYHNQMFKKLKEDRVYVKMSLTPAEIPAFFSEIKTLPFYGFSVTMPLKEHVDDKGAINTLTKRNGKWIGTNTDGIGALEVLGEVKGKFILIIGAGGTAKAIAAEASSRGGKVIIANRTLKKGEILAKQVGGMAISIDQVIETDYDILINTTSVGMFPSIEKMPIPKEGIREKKILLDVIVHPQETAFLIEGKKKDCKIIHGLEMFEKQANLQLTQWLEKF